MTVKVNTFEGGSDETVITTGNSGGASGDAFNVVALNTPTTEPAFDTARAFAGTLSMRCSQTAAAADFCIGRWTGMGSLTEAFGSFFVYFTANPASTCSVCHTQTTAGGQLGRIRVLTSGLIAIANTAGTIVATSTTAVNLNAWTRYEWRIRTTIPDFTVRISTDPNNTFFNEELNALLNDTTAYDRQEYGMSQTIGSGSLTYWMDNLSAGQTDWPYTKEATWTTKRSQFEKARAG